MAKSRRVIVIPHLRPEPDLDQIVLAVLATIDELSSKPKPSHEAKLSEERLS